MRAMVEAGVDIVEVGVPYSDPVMDGPVIQHAGEVALAGGTRTRDALRAVEAVAEAGAPAAGDDLLEPGRALRRRTLRRRPGRRRGAGLITPDLIPDEAGEWLDAAEQHDLDRVFLIAPAPPGPAGGHRAGLPRVRLRRVDDGRDRHAPSGRPDRQGPGGAGS